MLIRNTVLVLVLAASAQTPARADDLMSILGGESGIELTREESGLVSEVRAELKTTNAEQNIFLDFLSKGQVNKALYQWRAAFSDSEFAKSDRGQALYSYLLWQNGLPALALEQLFKVSEPNLLGPHLNKAWGEVAIPEHPAWAVARLQWREGWSRIFGLATEVRVRAHYLQDVEDIATLEELLKKTTPDSEERGLVGWQMVIALALKDEAAKSAKLLNHLLTAKQVIADSALMHLTAARLLYQNGYLDAAIQYYTKIPKSSEYWFEGQEELAWSYLRKGEPQNALATLQGLMIPAFIAQMGPESYQLRALAHLKICDYAAVAEDLKEFRNRFQGKARHLLAIKEGRSGDLLERFIGRLKGQRVALIAMGADALQLPRLVTRDEELHRRVQTLVGFAAEMMRAEELYLQSMSGSSAEVGFQRALEDLKVNAAQRRKSAHSDAVARVQFLAEEELREVQQTLQKMHIVEAELIQQVQMATRVKLATAKLQTEQKMGTTGAKGQDVLSFPFTGELWFDEIGHYKMDLKKGCQARAP